MSLSFLLLSLACFYKGLTQPFSMDTVIYLGMGVLLVWFAWFISPASSAAYPHKRVPPTARVIDSFTVEVTGDVDILRRTMGIASVDRWEKVGRDVWRVRLTGAAQDWDAREIAAQINRADGL